MKQGEAFAEALHMTFGRFGGETSDQVQVSAVALNHQAAAEIIELNEERQIQYVIKPFRARDFEDEEDDLEEDDLEDDDFEDDDFEDDDFEDDDLEDEDDDFEDDDDLEDEEEV